MMFVVWVVKNFSHRENSDSVREFDVWWSVFTGG